MSGLAAEALGIAFPPSPPTTTKKYDGVDEVFVVEPARVFPLGATPVPPRTPVSVITVQPDLQPQVLVRDPPREYLGGLRSSTEEETTVTRNPPIQDEQDTDDLYADLFGYYIYDNDAPFAKDSSGETKRALKSRSVVLKKKKSPMTLKKRGSLQAIFVPSFLQSTSSFPTFDSISPPTSPSPTSPTFPSRLRAASNADPSSSSSSATITPSTAMPSLEDKHHRKRSMTFSISSSKSGIFPSPSPPRTSPPPDFLIDEDPFANLTAAPAATFTRSSSFSSLSTSPSVDTPSPTVVSPPPPIPRSPLHEPTVSPPALVPPPLPYLPSVSPPSSPRMMPSGRAQTRPAYQRPAFSTRPSLPSLDTLARMNVVLTKKPRKGKVGAGLPFEPWDTLTSDDDCTIPSSTTAPMPIRAQSYTTSPTSYAPSQAASISATPTNNPSINAHLSSSTTMSTIPETLPISIVTSDSRSADPYVASTPSTPTMKPRPLLPSEILALGSVAADVEMMVPVSVYSPLPRSSPMQTPVRACPPPAPSSSARATPAPLPVVEEVEVPDILSSDAAVSTASPASPMTFAVPELDLVDELSLPHLSLSDPNEQPPLSATSTTSQSSWLDEPSLGDDFAADLEKDLQEVQSRRGSLETGGDGGYFGELLERYHRSRDSSRHTSLDGHEKASNVFPVPSDTGSTTEELPSEASTQLPVIEERSPMLQPSTSNISTPPPSVASNSASVSMLSLSRSISSTSYSSVDSVDQPSLAESADASADDDDDDDNDNEEYRREDEVEVEGRSVFDLDNLDRLSVRRNWQYNRFAQPTQSLSSLELDLDGGQDFHLDESDMGMNKSVYGDDEVEQHAQGHSTRSSSSRPSLSRTRSSSDDSEVLQSPTPDDYLFFPHAEARARAWASMGSAMIEGGQGDVVMGSNGISAVLDAEQVEEEERSRWSNVLSDPRYHQEFRIPGGFPGRGGDDTFEDGAVNGEKVMVTGEDDLRGSGEKEEEEEENVVENGELDEVVVDHLATDTRLVNTSFPVSSSEFDTEEKPVPASSTSSSFSPAGSGILLAPFPPLSSSTTSTSTTSPTSLSHPTRVPLPSPSSSEFVFPSRALSSEYQDLDDMPKPSSTTSPRANVMTSSSISSKSPNNNIYPSTMAQRNGITSSQGEPRESAGRGQTRGNNYYQSSSNYNNSQQASSSSSGRNYINHHSSTSRTDNRDRARRRGDTDDEDDEDEDKRRRRRVMDRMHAVTVGVAAESSSSGEELEEDDEEEGSDNYGQSSPAPVGNTKMGLAEPWQARRATSARSRSPSTAASFVTASSRSPSTAPMDFPSSSGQSSSSSRYVSEDERDNRVIRDNDDDDDDDVPLARRIPGALTAQKSIRRQFREEREQRKREKRARETERARLATLRPAGAGAGVVGAMSPDGGYASSSHDAAVMAAVALNAASGHSSSLQRQRTQTLPVQKISSDAFNPQVLAYKLQSVQLADGPPPPYQAHTSLGRAATHVRGKSSSRTSVDQQQQHLSSPVYTQQQSPASGSPAVRSRSVRHPPAQPQNQFSPTSPTVQAQVPPLPTLRPMRSFHRPSERRPSTADGDSEQRLGRSTTLANRTSHESRRSPSLGRVSGERFDRPVIPEEPVPPLPMNFNGRPSQDEHRRLQKPHQGSPEARLQQPPRVSGEVDRYTKQQTTVPQLPSLNRPVVTQQRIFVVNLQQFHMVEVSPSTSAGDVIALLDSQGVLTGWAGEGGWMIFEVAQDFGMERPVRSYELLADIQSSWIKDKTVNYFVVRLTPFAIPLRRSNIPASSPTHSGYVEWEAKRGKWSKRYLQLREHSLWLSKRDNGKDEIFLCSLSNFDAYHITRAHRAPKPFAFAIKSTDNLSFFEDTADYLHTFSASEKDGKIWMEKILIARSYVLHQERNVLFNPQSTATGGNASAAVTRSGTKKYAARPLQPLVAVPPVRVGGSSSQLSPKRNVFEPGSLLAKHT